MRFTDELRQAAEPIWAAQHEHPFVRGIGEGTLDPDKFRHYVRQDYLFLIDYARLLALGCARAPRLEDAARFAELAQAVLGSELKLHRSYAAEWGISPAALEAERPTATTRAYCDFLVRTATLGSRRPARGTRTGADRCGPPRSNSAGRAARARAVRVRAADRDRRP